MSESKVKTKTILTSYDKGSDVQRWVVTSYYRHRRLVRRS